MKNSQAKQIVYEFTDNCISACAVGYVKLENRIKPMVNIIMYRIKVIRSFYRNFVSTISSARESFIIRYKLKKLKSSHN